MNIQKTDLIDIDRSDDEREMNTQRTDQTDTDRSERREKDECPENRINWH